MPVQTFDTPGWHDFNVPNGVKSIEITLQGAGSASVRGGRVFGRVKVTGQDVLWVRIGGRGVQGGTSATIGSGGPAGLGRNGKANGWSGGGASYIRKNSKTGTLICVAGGAGGASGDSDRTDPDFPDWTGQGGRGGAAIGEAGNDGTAGPNSISNATGGTQNQGGFGGNSSQGAQFNGGNAGTATLDVGGTGGTATTSAISHGGGGGGGGYRAGGGGCASADTYAPGGGGGGGSNYVGGITGASSDQGAGSLDDGFIRLEYLDPDQANQPPGTPTALQINGVGEDTDMLTKALTQVNVSAVVHDSDDDRVRLFVEYKAKGSNDPFLSRKGDREPEGNRVNVAADRLKQNTLYEMRVWGEDEHGRQSLNYNGVTFWTNRKPFTDDLTVNGLDDNMSFADIDTATFRWRHNDPDVADHQTGFEINYRTAALGPAPAGAWVVFDKPSLNQSLSPKVDGPPSSSYGQWVFDADTFPGNRWYEWRVRTKDEGGQWGDWSVGLFSFYVTSLTTPPINLDPHGGEAVEVEDTVRFSWKFIDPDPEDSQQKADIRYRVVGRTIAETHVATNYVSNPSFETAVGINPWHSNAVFGGGAIATLSRTEGPPTPTDRQYAMKVDWAADFTAGNANLLAEDESTFETGVAGWTGVGGATAAQSATRVFQGANSMRVAWVPDIVQWMFSNETLVVGQRYRLSAMVWVPSGATRVAVGNYELGAKGAPNSAFDQWVKVSYDFTATATTMGMLILPDAGPIAGSSVYVDDVQLKAVRGQSNCLILCPLVPKDAQMTLSARVYVPSGNPDVNLEIAFLAASPMITTKDQWVWTDLPFTTGPTDTHYFVGVKSIDRAGGGVCYIDQVIFRDGAPGAIPYFDGETPDSDPQPGATGSRYTWLGTPDDSSSIYETVEWVAQADEEVTEDDWIVVLGEVAPGEPDGNEFWDLEEGLFLPGYQYEWQVRTYDEGLLPSSWSDSAFFWGIETPGSGIEPIDPSIPTFPQGSLGCGEYRVYIFQQGGDRMIGEITPLTHLTFNRVRDDISNALVTTRGFPGECCALLGGLRSWLHEVVIYRDNDRVWEGPITRITYEQDQVEIEAKDCMAYIYRRIMKQGYNDTYKVVNQQEVGGVSVVERAQRIALNALAPGDPNLIRFLTAFHNPDDATQNRVVLDYSTTAWEQIDDLAATAGLDYTVVGRRIMFWDTHRQIGRLPVMRDGDFSNSLIVTEYGMQLATFFAVTNGSGVAGWTESEFGTSGNPYGPIELLASSYSEDGAAAAEVMTAESLNKLQESLTEQAKRNISDRYPAPIVVRVPDNSRVSPDANVGFQQLVPGIWVPLAAERLCRTVTQWQKLDSVSVDYTQGSESVNVVLSQAPNGGRDPDADAAAEEG